MEYIDPFLDPPRRSNPLPPQHSARELIWIAQDLIAHDRGESVQLRVNYADLEQVIAGADLPGMPAAGPRLARQRLREAVARGSKAAIDTQSRLDGTAPPAEPTSFEGNAPMWDLVKRLTAYLNGSVLHWRFKPTELAEVVESGPKQGTDPQVIDLARRRLIEAADSCNQTARTLVVELGLAVTA